MSKFSLLLSTSLLACFAAATPAFAQDVPAAAETPARHPQDDAAPASASPAQAARAPDGQTPVDGAALQDIIVTAERRFNTAQKTAAAISVRPGAEMLRQGRYELKNILEDVPGVVGGAASTVATSQGSGTDNPAAGLVIRGVQPNSGAGGSATSTSSTAAIYVDDVYNGIGGNYDIDRVEVLRGPQGTLYGRSATSGVVAIQTGAPDASAISMSGTGEVGNFALRHLTGDVNIPIIQDKLAVRASGNLYKRDGYYSAQGGAVSSEAFRVKALFTPTDNFSALIGYAQEFNVTHSGGVSIRQGDSPTDFIYTPQEVGTGRNHFRQYWANFKLDLGPVEVTYIPAVRTWYQNATIVARGTVFNADQTIVTPDDKFVTHELRIHSAPNDSKFSWQTGAMYYRNTLNTVNNLYNLDLGRFLFKDTTDKTTTAAGVFAEGIYAFAPTTRLTAGVRYDYTKVAVTQDYTSVIGTTATLRGEQGVRKFNNVTYKARIEHDLAPRNLVYASISTGFSPGDITLTTGQDFQPVVQTLEAETLTAYEVGSKNRFLNDRLQINGALFYYDYAGYQTAQINLTPENPGNPTFRTITVPLRSYGAELEVQARPWANGTFSLNASYTNARYGDFGIYKTYFSTQKVSGVPPLQGNVAYDHRIPLGGEATLALRGVVRFFTAHDRSRLTQEWADLGAGPYGHVNSQALADFNATLIINPQFSITGYVRNLTDNRFLPDGWAIGSVMPSMTPGGPLQVSTDRAALSDPRTFGMIVSFRY